jgi:hypothetical protein
MNSYGNNDDEKLRAEIENDLYYLGTFGMGDTIRPDIDKPINLIKYGHNDTTIET